MRTRGIGAALLSVAVAFAVVVATFVLAHRSSRALSRQSALAEIEHRREELDRTSRSTSDSRSSSGTARVLHTMVYDTRGQGRLVYVEAPAWWIRLTHRDQVIRSLGELTFFDDTEFDPDAVELSVPELLLQAPRVLVDVEHPSGARLLCWSQ